MHAKHAKLHDAALLVVIGQYLDRCMIIATSRIGPDRGNSTLHVLFNCETIVTNQFRETFLNRTVLYYVL